MSRFITAVVLLASLAVSVQADTDVAKVLDAAQLGGNDTDSLPQPAAYKPAKHKHHKHHKSSWGDDDDGCGDDDDDDGGYITKIGEDASVGPGGIFNDIGGGMSIGPNGGIFNSIGSNIISNGQGCTYTVVGGRRLQQLALNVSDVLNAAQVGEIH